MDGVENSRITNEQVRKARKGIYKLPEFQDFQKFQQDWSKKGLPTAIKERGWSSFKTEYVKGLKDLHPGQWKEAFKELGNTGKFLKEQPYLERLCQLEITLLKLKKMDGNYMM